MEQMKEQLAAQEASLKAAVPLEVQHILSQSIAEQQRTGKYNGLAAGGRAPDFTLKDAVGKEVNLYKLAAEGPVVLTFYRGGWCPFCNIQLRAYQKMLPRLRELGASLVAVSPQSPDNTLSQAEKEQLTFTVASDTDGLVAARYNLLYEVEEPLRSVLQSFGGDLAEYNASDRWMLPVPATFIIDGSATIRFAHVDPNYMSRLAPEAIVRALEGM